MMEARKLSHRFGQNWVLREVSAALAPGRLTAILGPNGAGKTSLLRCLAGALTPSHGGVWLDGAPLAHYGLRALARKRAVLSQSVPIAFPFTAREIVLMGRNPYDADASPGTDAAIAEQALRSMDVWDLRARIFPTLSGGEQQRVQLARVLAQVWEQERAYLLLDEPTSALDLKHQHHVLDALRRLARERHYAVGLVMHAVHLARRYADEAVLLRGGRVAVAGASRTILTARNLARVFDIAPKFLSVPAA